MSKINSIIDTSFLNSESIVSLNRPWSSKCFACAKENEFSLKMEFKFDKNSGSTFSIHKINENYSGFNDFVHGGIIATLLDEAGGWTLITNLHTAGFTKESQIKYKKPVPINTDLLIIGNLVDNSNQKNVVVKSTISLMSGVVLAEMQSVWYIPTLDQLTKISGKSKEQLLYLRRNFDNTINQIS